MAEYRLDSVRDTVTHVFSRELPAVLTVDPGDTVVVHSLDSSGHLKRQRTPGEATPRMFEGLRGHCLAGPIAVRGAEPGMALAVRLESLRPDDWGFTAAASADTPLNRRLGLADADPAWLLWELDADAGTGTDQYGHTVSLAPFLGVIGMPPAEPGEHSTTPPRAPGGGNIDCRELVAGSTLFLPVTVPEALLCVGDGHAAQGDGEVSGTAIECGMTSRLTLDLETAPPVPTAHAVTPAGRITFGFDQDLNEASAVALDAMLTWMMSLFGLDRATALALASSTVDLRVTQVANQVWGVHAVLPAGAVR
ncbi:acetamidase/formamidase family protein [Streptomyces sp. AK02-01A]|uniref:acetamidase/formamidase family protein n=1 Tax=Streptomyces sp. AK02-01A TaxID=3028648 RepID=UPI0029B4CC4F|nr:acetamidase/formamidase family protein [Streptomyces sp. AK02-01A]MDX3851867.1 acetamidase/formamidase family protein [Streptomyces sp. AK02-01A]